MKAFFSTLFIALFFFTQSTVQAEEDEIKYTFALPINWASPIKYNLVVSIPENFHSLQPLSEIAREDKTLIEFIPKGEPEDNWTEIITVVKYIGKGLSASKLIQSLQQTMLAQSSNGKSWKENVIKKTSYEKAFLGLTYDYQGRHEIIGAKYYSGPYDCVGVQYTIRPAKGQPDKEAMDKIEKFFKTNTHVDTVGESLNH